MMKWIVAALAAANGLGALKAVSHNVTHQNDAMATVVFTVGIIVAFLAAASVDYAVRRVEHPDLELGNYWAHADFTGKRDARREAELQAQMHRAGRVLLIPPLIAAASAGLFVAGMILLN